MLAKGSDPNLKKLATDELARPSDSETLLRLGDEWWNIASRQPQLPQASIRHRAAKCYAGCGSGLSPLQRIKVDKRIAEAGDGTHPDAPQAHSPIGPDPKSKLTPEQLAVVQGLHFSGFSGHKNRSFTHVFFELQVDNESPSGLIDDNLTAAVQYLCIDGDQKKRVLTSIEKMTITKKGTQEVGIKGDLTTATLTKYNHGDWKPADVHIVVSYQGVPIFEAKEDQKNSVRWWDDASLIVK